MSYAGKVITLVLILVISHMWSEWNLMLVLYPTAITCTSMPCTWNRGSLKRNPTIVNKRQYTSFKIDILRRATYDPRATKFQEPASNQSRNDFLCSLSYKERDCMFQRIMVVTYTDFTLEESDLMLLRSRRDHFYDALKREIAACNVSGVIGPFEVEGTKNQSSTEKWRKMRALCCSAQPSRTVSKFKTETAKMNHLRHHLWGMDAVTTKGMAYGTRYESTARRKYEEEQKEKDPTAVVEVCGLFMHTELAGLSCSPDGIRTSQCCPTRKLLEIKILYNLRKEDPNQFDTHLPKKKLSSFCLKREDNGNIALKTNHPYYDQVQFSMGLLGLQECDFFVWTPKNHLTLSIPFNEERWKELRESSEKFHWQYLAPEYFAMKTPRKLNPVKLDK